MIVKTVNIVIICKERRLIGKDSLNVRVDFVGSIPSTVAFLIFNGTGIVWADKKFGK